MGWCVHKQFREQDSDLGLGWNEILFCSKESDFLWQLYQQGTL
jgi:hypothetical protein